MLSSSCLQLPDGVNLIMRIYTWCCDCGVTDCTAVAVIMVSYGVNCGCVDH